MHLFFCNCAPRLSDKMSYHHKGVKNLEQPMAWLTAHFPNTWNHTWSGNPPFPKILDPPLHQDQSLNSSSANVDSKRYRQPELKQQKHVYC